MVASAGERTLIGDDPNKLKFGSEVIVGERTRLDVAGSWQAHQALFPRLCGEAQPRAPLAAGP